MTDPIQKLIDQIIDDFLHLKKRTGTALRRILHNVIAEYLDCWTQIDKDNPATWPEKGRRFLLATPRSQKEWWLDLKKISSLGNTNMENWANVYHGSRFRYFDLAVDRPPEGG